MGGARLAGVLALKALFSTPRGSVLTERVPLDRLVTWGLVAVFAAIAAWNAFTYPPIGGFDASEHIAYARGLADRGELPTGGASYTPPGFYVLAAGAIELGDALGLDEPERVVQLHERRARCRHGAAPAGADRVALPRPACRSLDGACLLRLVPHRSPDRGDVPPATAGAACSRRSRSCSRLA